MRSRAVLLTILVCTMFSGQTVRAGEGFRIEIDTCGIWSDVWAGDTIFLPVLVAAEGTEQTPCAFLETFWRKGGRSAVPLPVPPMEPGGSVRLRPELTLPCIGDRPESLMVRVVTCPPEWETVASETILVGTTVPGESFHLPAAGGTVREIALGDSLLLIEQGETIVPVILPDREELTALSVKGADGSPGDGCFLYAFNGRIYHLDIPTGERRRISDPAFYAYRPEAGKRFNVWARSCCGLPGEMIVRSIEGGEKYGIPFEHPLEGNIALGEGWAVWVERGEAEWTLILADLDRRNRRTVHTSGEPIGQPDADGEGFVFTAADAGERVLYYSQFGSELLDTLDHPTGGPGAITLDDGIVIWKSCEAEGVRFLCRTVKSGRRYLLYSGDETVGAPALSGSTLVWVEGDSLNRSVRGLRLHLPPEGGENAGWRDVDVQFEAVLARAGSVRLHWVLTGDVTACPYSVIRLGEGDRGVDDGTVVGSGEVTGPGYYRSTDGSIPAPGGEERFHYYVRFDTSEEPLLFGPVTLTVPERFPSLALKADGPHPFQGEVRFTLIVPAGGSGGDVRWKVYDCRGRLIAERRSGRAEAGRIPLVWDRTDRRGRPVSPGLYFFRVTVGERFQETRKMILIR